jgi:hypothetical protein
VKIVGKRRKRRKRKKRKNKRKRRRKKKKRKKRKKRKKKECNRLESIGNMSIGNMSDAKAFTDYLIHDVQIRDQTLVSGEDNIDVESNEPKEDYLENDDNDSSVCSSSCEDIQLDETEDKEEDEDVYTGDENTLFKEDKEKMSKQMETLIEKLPSPIGGIRYVYIKVSNPVVFTPMRM